VPDAGFSHFAGADDHDRLVVKIAAEDFLGQLHGHAAHRGGAPSDLRLGADGFDHLKGALEGAIENPPGQMRGARRLVGGLDLAGDFRLAQDHRIQAAGDGEEIAGGGFLGMDIDIRGNIHLGARERGEQFNQSLGVRSATPYNSTRLQVETRTNSERPPCSLSRVAVSMRRDGITASCSRNATGAVLKLIPATNIMRASWLCGFDHCFFYTYLRSFMLP
jgi:hypothetical protein